MPSTPSPVPPPPPSVDAAGSVQSSATAVPPAVVAAASTPAAPSNGRGEVATGTPTSTPSQSNGTTAKRNPKNPKKPETPFAYFSREQRREHKEEVEALTPPEATKLLRERWDALDAAGKAPFEKQSNAAREKYEAFERANSVQADGVPVPPMSVGGQTVAATVTAAVRAAAAAAVASPSGKGAGPAPKATSNGEGDVAEEGVTEEKELVDDGEDEEEDDHFCDVCKKENGTAKNPIVICDKCDRGFHAKCHTVRHWTCAQFCTHFQI